MPDLKKPFHWRCPEGHDVRATFEEASLRSNPDNGIVKAFCPDCGRDYELSPNTLANVKRWLDRKA